MSISFLDLPHNGSFFQYHKHNFLEAIAHVFLEADLSNDRGYRWDWARDSKKIEREAGPIQPDLSVKILTPKRVGADRRGHAVGDEMPFAHLLSSILRAPKAPIQ